MAVYNQEENMQTFKGKSQVMELSKQLGKVLPDNIGINSPDGAQHYDFPTEYDASGRLTPGCEASLRKAGWTGKIGAESRSPQT